MEVIVTWRINWPTVALIAVVIILWLYIVDQQDQLEQWQTILNDLELG